MRVIVTLAAVAAVLGVPPPAGADDGGWRWPVEGRVLTLYANDNSRPYAGGMHRGIDIAADTGTEVVAARAGTVTHAGVVGSAGLTVAIRTADGRYGTSYLHLSAATVRKGDPVATGAPIGAVGTSGQRSVSEPHLHFGVRLTEPADHYVNPLSLLPARPAPTVSPPPVPAPAPAPVRAVPEPVPGQKLAPAARRDAHPARAPARLRSPLGTVQPGPVAALRPVGVPAPARRHAAQRPHRVPVGPPPRRAPATVPAGAPAGGSAKSPVPGAGVGRVLVLVGVAMLALVLFGRLALRALGRANGGVNARMAAAAGFFRDQHRLVPARRRLPFG
jgi:hypothetical protein